MIRRDVEKSLRNMFERGYKQGYEDALKKNKREWIPISSIDEIPKEGAYWVTFKYENGHRETSHIGWDTFHEHWDDEEGWALDNADCIIAYMPYFEPEPYNAESKDPNDLTHIFDGVNEIPKDAFKGWTTEEMLEQTRAESEE